MQIGRKIVFLTLLFSFLFSNTAENVSVQLADPLCRAMQATGAELSKAYITGSIRLPATAADDLKAMVCEAGDALGREENEAVEIRTSDYQKLASLSFNRPETQLIVYAKYVKELNSNCKNIEFLVRIIKENPTEEDLGIYKRKILGVLQKKAAEPIISTCLEGYLDGKLRKDEWVYCIQDAFAAIGAQSLTQTWNQHYASYTGWTPIIKENLQIGNNTVNFNIAMRYHSFDQRTYVTIGSPIIGIEY